MCRASGTIPTRVAGFPTPRASRRPRSSTSPSSRRPATRSEVDVGVRCVARARSARLSGPSLMSDCSIRLRLWRRASSGTAFAVARNDRVKAGGRSLAILRLYTFLIYSVKDGAQRRAPTPPNQAGDITPGVTTTASFRTRQARGRPVRDTGVADERLGGARVILAFGDCELDLDRYELHRAGLLVPIEPQVFDVLVHLASHPDRVVSKEELLDTVWGDRFVSESALTSRIKAARRAVGDDGTRQAVIATAHGRGYRMVVPVDERGGNGRGELRAPPPPLDDVHPLALLERDEPLAELTRALGAARSGSGRLVCVAGEAGIGKSALIRSFADQAADHAPGHGHGLRRPLDAAGARPDPRPRRPAPGRPPARPRGRPQRDQPVAGPRGHRRGARVRRRDRGPPLGRRRDARRDPPARRRASASCRWSSS